MVKIYLLLYLFIKLFFPLSFQISLFYSHINSNVILPFSRRLLPFSLTSSTPLSYNFHLSWFDWHKIPSLWLFLVTSFYVSCLTLSLSPYLFLSYIFLYVIFLCPVYFFMLSFSVLCISLCYLSLSYVFLYVIFLCLPLYLFIYLSIYLFLSLFFSFSLSLYFLVYERGGEELNSFLPSVFYFDHPDESSTAQSQGR